MREIRVILEDNEHRHLNEKKGFLSWKEYLIKTKLQETKYQPKKGRG